MLRMPASSARDEESSACRRNGGRRACCPADARRSHHRGRAVHRGPLMASRREWRARQKANGLCTRCSSPSAPGKTMCPQHLATRKVANRRRRSGPTAPGECSAAGCHRKARPDRKLCAGCIQTKTRHSNRRRDRGQCHQCNRPAEPGKTLCSRHLVVTRDRTKAARARRIASGECLTPGCTRDPGRFRRCFQCRLEVAAYQAHWRAGKTAVDVPFSRDSGVVGDSFDDLAVSRA